MTAAPAAPVLIMRGVVIVGSFIVGFLLRVREARRATVANRAVMSRPAARLAPG